jgi:outer membrane protein assembly factor BamB
MLRTTIYCGVGALTVVASGLAQTPLPRPFPDPGASARASRPTVAAPLALFPVRTLWTLALNSDLTTSPAFDGVLGFFAIQGERLAAYRLDTGELLWIVQAQPVSQPAAGDGLLFIAEPNSIVAIRQADGTTAWRVPFNVQPGTRLVLASGWLISAGPSGIVAAFRPLDGEVLWRREIGIAVNASPAQSADRVYLAAEDGRLIALRVDTGEGVWERRLGGAPNEMLAFDDLLFVGSNDNYFYSIRTENGEVNWRWRTGGDVIGRAVADDRRVYFVSLDNVLRALDRRSGAQRWKRALPLRPIGGPVKAGDALLVIGLAPAVRAYRTSDGSPAGDTTAPGDLAAPPHVIAEAALPTVILISRDIAKGATVMAIGRAIEPAIVPVAPLPNPMPLPPNP